MPYVLVNGWSATAELWQQFAQLFSANEHFDVIDLDRALSLDQWLDVIDSRVNGGDVLLGWSLGGELAIKYASVTSKQLRAMCLLNTNPCFVRRDGWQSGMPLELFNEFDGLVSRGNASQVLKQFAFMMVQGSVELRSDRKVMKQIYETHTDYDIQALISGMDLLRALDVRPELEQLEIPVLKVLGAADSLVPVSLAKSYPAKVIDGMAHLPCLSYKKQTFAAIMEFLSDHD